MYEQVSKELFPNPIPPLGQHQWHCAALDMAFFMPKPGSWGAGALPCMDMTPMHQAGQCVGGSQRQLLGEGC